MNRVICTNRQIDETLGHLQAAGRRGTESVVLWLGNETHKGIEVTAVYRPAQIAGADIFRIPPPAMQELIALLSSKGWMIAAQVHSHPFEAFHSAADDRWAIIRHENALSLVIPYFARRTNTASFLTDQKIFRLTASNQWRELPEHEVGQWLQII